MKGGKIPLRRWEKVQGLLVDGVADGVYPGAVLRVFDDHHTLFKYSTGYASLAPVKRKMTDDTLFDIASLTKTIATTSAIMILFQKGLVSLTQSLTDYFTETPADKAEITLLHLLTHSSGLPAWKPLYRELEAEEQKTGVRITGTDLVKGFFLRSILNAPLVFKPGTQVLYSDLGFILLGMIVENCVSERLSNFLRKHVFVPLKIKNAFFVTVEERIQKRYRIAATEDCPWRKRIIIGEVHDENAYALGGVAGHAGLFATAEEIEKFSIELMHAYYGKGKVFEKEVVRRFLRRQGLPPGSTWALGWDTPSDKFSSSGRYFSASSVGHTGFTGVSLWIDLERKIGITLLTNRIHPSRENLKIREFRPKIHDAIMEALGYAKD